MVLSATEQGATVASDTAGEKIFVVMGTTGEYSDRSEWPVRAFFTQQQARDWADAAKARMHELADGRQLEYSQRERLAKLNQYDPGHMWDYTDTDWFVYEVPLDRSPAALPESKPQPANRGGIQEP